MQKEIIRILYLDDEVENLVAFKANFRKYFEIHTVTTPQESLDILNSHHIHVFMIDQKMPEVSGIQLLKLINEDFPNLMKILVTGYVDFDDAFKKENSDADVFRYIYKPWNDYEIRRAIADAYEIYCFKRAKDEEVVNYKRDVLERIRGPIYNLEGLLMLARNEMKDELALSDYFSNMKKSIDILKSKLA